MSVASAGPVEDVLDPRHHPDLGAFWRFYEARGDAITGRLDDAARAHPEWLPILEPGARRDRHHALLRQAVGDGDWQPFIEHLRTEGGRFAHDGLGHRAVLGVVAGFRDAVRGELSEFAAEDAETNVAEAARVSRGLNLLLDVIRHSLVDAYLTAQESHLAGSEDRYRSMFDHSPLPMWMFDLETLRFVAVNEAAVRQYGYSREEFAQLTIRDIRPPEALDALHDDLRDAKGFTAEKTWQHRRKDGSLITVEISANDYVVDGRPVRLVLAHDVSERERARASLLKTEEQLRQAQKMDAIGRLAGGVAHDFNNVLTVIQGYSSLLEESLEVDDSRRDDATEIRRAAERAAAITGQLLTLSRHGVASPRAIALDEVVEGFVPMLRRLVGERITVVTHCSEVPTVVADPGQIEQVLMNLAVNARDAMPDGGRLTIETQLLEVAADSAELRRLPVGHYVVLAVTDTGVGMDAETRQRIFEPFYTTKSQGSTAGVGVGGGTGLGLAIAHGIVSQAGGSIAVYSEVGHGTTFRVRLPVHEAGDQPVAPRPAEPIAGAVSLPPLTVLVVDDDREVRSLAARVLQDAGCRVLEAATAAEARRICVSHEGVIDVAVLDVVLPDDRGDLLIDQLHDLRTGLEVVLMSGYPAGSLTANGAAPPDLLPKPFTPSELRAAVGRVSGARTARAASEGDEPGAVPAVAKASVLLADDDDHLRRAFSRILTRAELEVVEAATGRAAIAQLESRRFDVILSDVHMPEGGGLDLMRAVRRIDLDVPVILMTGMPDVQSAVTAVEQGAFRYLTKPVDADALRKTVQHAVRAHTLARLRREALSVSGVYAGAADRAGLEVRLDLALEGLWMAYQPIVEARTGALFGVEALMRSTEPSMPTPRSLLDAATQLDRLPEIGRRVRAMCAEGFAERSDRATLFVNLHADDLADVDLVDPGAPLSGVAPQVVLEVTERASLDSGLALTERLARLRELGYRIAVDDIGAGYSGLKSFTELTPEFVKLDMSLVRDIHLSALKQRMVEALCRLCHEIGSVVVGEGVESPDERETLVALGCDLLQGFLIGRPARRPD